LERYTQKILRKQKDIDDRSLRYLLKGEGFSSSAILQFFEE